MSSTVAQGAPADAGWIRLNRRIFDHPIFRSKQEAAVWVWMLTQAAWRTTRVYDAGQLRTLEPGDLIACKRQISEDFGLHRTTVDRLMKRLIEDRMIAQKSGQSRGHSAATIHIVNYHLYQRVMPCSDEGSGHDAASETATMRPPCGHDAATDPLICEQNQTLNPPLQYNNITKERLVHSSDRFRDPPSECVQPETDPATEGEDIPDVASDPVRPAAADDPLVWPAEEPVAPPAAVEPAQAASTEGGEEPTKRRSGRRGTTREKPPRGTSGEIIADFERWWTEYPASRRVKKPFALKAYIKARATASAQQLLEGLRLFRFSGQRWDPHPSSWLNAQRWLDDPASRDVPPDRPAPLDWIARRRAAAAADQGHLVLDGEILEPETTR